MKAKQDSLINALKNLGNPSCVLIQESKLRHQGTFKLKGYQIFEKIRGGQGGGLLTAINENLSPMLISEGSEEEEILIAQILVGKQKIRIINAYGPQENDLKDRVLSFWQEFEKQIINAKYDDCLVLVEMDANAKLGANIIKNDPHCISENGLLLRDIIQRQNLICLNAHGSCEGSITRHRKTVCGDEKAILDFIIVCDQLGEFFQRMIVDEKRVNVLTKYVSLKGVRVKRESDHNPVYAEFNLKFSRAKSSVRQEMFDFRNEESMRNFSEITNNCKKLRNCFDGNLSQSDAFDKFSKSLNNTFHLAFKKIRIRSSNQTT